MRKRQVRWDAVFWSVWKIPCQIVALETGKPSKIRRLVTLLKMELEQKSHLAHRKARSCEIMTPPHSWSQKTMLAEAVLSVLWEFKSVGFGWLFPCQMEAARFFSKRRFGNVCGKKEEPAKCILEKMPKNSSDLLGGSLDLPQTFDTSAPWMYFYLRAAGVEPKAVVNHAGALFRLIFEDLGPFLLSPFRNTWNFFLSCKLTKLVRHQR